MLPIGRTKNILTVRTNLKSYEKTIDIRICFFNMSYDACFTFTLEQV